jgi:hypothetical protein
LLFFFLGVAATMLRSDLEIPGQVAKFLSLYLLFAIGFKGGVALSESSIDLASMRGLLAAIVLSIVVPIYTFYFLKNRIELANAAAIAATYGSISAVTFVTATSYLDTNNIEWSGYLVAAMALMESPAIILGVLLYHFYRGKESDAGDDESNQIPWGEMLREACFNGSVFLVLGALVIGWITGAEGMRQVSPLVKDLFTGVLCLFLLDMGIVAAKRLGDLIGVRGSGRNPLLLIGTAIGIPVVNAALGTAVAILLNLSEGDAVLLIVLAASASYIAVPAAMRLSLPEANPSIYLPMSLTITFPFNILIGIPLYHAAVRFLQ